MKIEELKRKSNKFHEHDQCYVRVRDNWLSNSN